MMLILIADIRFQNINFVRVNRKCTVSILPIEIFKSMAFCFHPLRRMCFQFSNECNKWYFFGEEAKDVNMIEVTTYNNGIAFKIFANSAHIIIEFQVNRRDDKWLPVFCAKDNV